MKAEEGGPITIKLWRDQNGQVWRVNPSTTAAQQDSSSQQQQDHVKQGQLLQQSKQEQDKQEEQPHYHELEELLRELEQDPPKEPLLELEKTVKDQQQTGLSGTEQHQLELQGTEHLVRSHEQQHTELQQQSEQQLRKDQVQQELVLKSVKQPINNSKCKPQLHNSKTLPRNHCDQQKTNFLASKHLSSEQKQRHESSKQQEQLQLEKPNADLHLRGHQVPQESEQLLRKHQVEQQLELKVSDQFSRKCKQLVKSKGKEVLRKYKDQRVHLNVSEQQLTKHREREKPASQRSEHQPRKHQSKQQSHKQKEQEKQPRKHSYQQPEQQSRKHQEALRKVHESEKKLVEHREQQLKIQTSDRVPGTHQQLLRSQESEPQSQKHQEKQGNSLQESQKKPKKHKEDHKPIKQEKVQGSEQQLRKYLKCDSGVSELTSLLHQSEGSLPTYTQWTRLKHILLQQIECQDSSKGLAPCQQGTVNMHSTGEQVLGEIIPGNSGHLKIDSITHTSLCKQNPSSLDNKSSDIAFEAISNKCRTPCKCILYHRRYQHQSSSSSLEEDFRPWQKKLLPVSIPLSVIKDPSLMSKLQLPAAGKDPAANTDAADEGATDAKDSSVSEYNPNDDQSSEASTSCSTPTHSSHGGRKRKKLRSPASAQKRTQKRRRPGKTPEEQEHDETVRLAQDLPKHNWLLEKIAALDKPNCTAAESPPSADPSPVKEVACRLRTTSTDSLSSCSTVINVTSDVAGTAGFGLKPNVAPVPTGAVSPDTTAHNVSSPKERALITSKKDAVTITKETEDSVTIHKETDMTNSEVVNVNASKEADMISSKGSTTNRSVIKDSSNPSSHPSRSGKKSFLLERKENKTLTEKKQNSNSKSFEETTRDSGSSLPLSFLALRQKVNEAMQEEGEPDARLHSGVKPISKRRRGRPKGGTRQVAKASLRQPVSAVQIQTSSESSNSNAVNRDLAEHGNREQTEEDRDNLENSLVNQLNHSTPVANNAQSQQQVRLNERLHTDSQRSIENVSPVLRTYEENTEGQQDGRELLKEKQSSTICEVSLLDEKETDDNSEAIQKEENSNQKSVSHSTHNPESQQMMDATEESIQTQEKQTTVDENEVAAVSEAVLHEQEMRQNLGEHQHAQSNQHEQQAAKSKRYMPKVCLNASAVATIFEKSNMDALQEQHRHQTEENLRQTMHLQQLPPQLVEQQVRQNVLSQTPHIVEGLLDYKRRHFLSRQVITAYDEGIKRQVPVADRNAQLAGPLTTAVTTHCSVSPVVPGERTRDGFGNYEDCDPPRPCVPPPPEVSKTVEDVMNLKLRNFKPIHDREGRQEQTDSRRIPRTKKTQAVPVNRSATHLVTVPPPERIVDNSEAFLHKVERVEGSHNRLAPAASGRPPQRWNLDKFVTSQPQIAPTRVVSQNFRAGSVMHSPTAGVGVRTNAVPGCYIRGFPATGTAQLSPDTSASSAPVVVSDRNLQGSYQGTARTERSPVNRMNSNPQSHDNVMIPVNSRFNSSVTCDCCFPTPLSPNHQYTVPYHRQDPLVSRKAQNGGIIETEPESAPITRESIQFLTDNQHFLTVGPKLCSRVSSSHVSPCRETHCHLKNCLTEYRTQIGARMEQPCVAANCTAPSLLDHNRKQSDCSARMIVPVSQHCTVAQVSQPAALRGCPVNDRTQAEHISVKDKMANNSEAGRQEMGNCHHPTSVVLQQFQPNQEEITRSLELRRSVDGDSHCQTTINLHHSPKSSVHSISHTVGNGTAAHMMPVVNRSVHNCLQANESETDPLNKRVRQSRITDYTSCSSVSRKTQREHTHGEMTEQSAESVFSKEIIQDNVPTNQVGGRLHQLTPPDQLRLKIVDVRTISNESGSIINVPETSVQCSRANNSFSENMTRDIVIRYSPRHSLKGNGNTSGVHQTSQNQETEQSPEVEIHLIKNNNTVMQHLPDHHSSSCCDEKRTRQQDDAVTIQLSELAEGPTSSSGSRFQKSSGHTFETIVLDDDDGEDAEEDTPSQDHHQPLGGTKNCRDDAAAASVTSQGDSFTVSSHRTLSNAPSFPPSLSMPHHRDGNNVPVIDLSQEEKVHTLPHQVTNNRAQQRENVFDGAQADVQLIRRTSGFSPSHFQQNEVTASQSCPFTSGASSQMMYSQSQSHVHGTAQPISSAYQNGAQSMSGLHSSRFSAPVRFKSPEAYIHPNRIHTMGNHATGMSDRRNLYIEEQSRKDYINCPNGGYVTHPMPFALPARTGTWLGGSAVQCSSHNSWNEHFFRQQVPVPERMSQRMPPTRLNHSQEQLRLMAYNQQQQQLFQEQQWQKEMQLRNQQQRELQRQMFRH